MRGFVRFGLPLAVALVLFANTVEGATISFTSTDLGGGEWQYDYVVSGTTFHAYEGFTVLFDPSLYEGLTGESTANAPWLLRVLQPDPALPDYGLFDAIALADGAALTDPFSIRFKFLGAGAPGAQPFELTLWEAFDPNDPAADPLFLASRGSGVTVPASVPEPAALLLFGGALGALARRLRRRARAT